MMSRRADSPDLSVNLSRINFNKNDRTVKRTTKPTLETQDSVAPPADSPDGTQAETGDDTAKQKGRGPEGTENQQPVTYQSAALQQRNIADAAKQVANQTTTKSDKVDFTQVAEAIDESKPKEEPSIRRTISDVNRLPDFLSHTNDLTGFGNQEFNSGREDIAKINPNDTKDLFRPDSVTDRYGLATPEDVGLDSSGSSNPIDQLTGAVDGSGLVGGGPNIAIAVANNTGTWVENGATNPFDGGQVVDGTDPFGANADKDVDSFAPAPEVDDASLLQGPQN